MMMMGRVAQRLDDYKECQESIQLALEAYKKAQNTEEDSGGGGGTTNLYCFYYILTLPFADVRYEILTALKISMMLFWVVTPCGIVSRSQNFGGTYCLHLGSYEGLSM
jgi:hypothetical protein